jgi:hypothetical protein
MPSHSVKKTYGTVSAGRQKEMSGLEFVQGLADGTLPLNTIAQTLGYDVTEAETGVSSLLRNPGTSTSIPPARCMAVSRPQCSTAAWGSRSNRRWKRASSTAVISIPGSSRLRARRPSLGSANTLAETGGSKGPSVAFHKRQYCPHHLEQSAAEPPLAANSR